MDEYPSNSHKSREQPERVRKSDSKTHEEVPQERRSVEKVVEGEVVRRKKPVGRRFKEFFFGSVDAQSVWHYIAQDILVPAAKDAIADATSGGIDRILFSEDRGHHRRRGRHGGPSRVNYTRYSRPYDDRPPFPPADRRRERDREPIESRRANDRYNFDDILLATRAEAEIVLERLYDLIGEYDTASVSDLMDLVGLSAQYTDNKWGWYDLRGSSVRRTREGYLVDLPRPVSLD